MEKEKLIRGLRRPKHLTPDQWETLRRAAELAELAARKEASVELFYNHLLRGTPYTIKENGPLDILKKELAAAWAALRAHCETEEYAAAVLADTCMPKSKR